MGDAAAVARVGLMLHCCGSVNCSPRSTIIIIVVIVVVVVVVALWGQTQDVLRHQISHCPTSSEVRERSSKSVCAVERMSEASSVEPADEQAVRANEQTDVRVAQYLRPDF